MAEGPDLEATERAAGGGQVPRPGRLADPRGRVHEGAVTGYGWPVLRVIAAATTRPLAVNGGQLQAPEGRWARAGAGSPVGRRVHTVRQGQGQAAGTER